MESAFDDRVVVVKTTTPEALADEPVPCDPTSEGAIGAPQWPDRQYRLRRYHGMWRKTELTHNT